MSLGITVQLLLVSQPMILRALGNEWSVKYNQQNLCVLKGSTVFMNGSYTHPEDVTINERFWVINPVRGIMPIDLRNEPGYSGRVEYLGDEQKHFSLILSNVNETDGHEYCFRVLATASANNYLFYPGIRLTVTELQVVAPEQALEGNKTILVCSATCSLSDTQVFVWYKNQRCIAANQNDSDSLILQPTKAEDAGSYQCAVRGYEHLRSPARTLSVRYPPKNVSVSISPSGKIAKGGSVTLTCSGDANPPVQNYTWFQGRTLVGKEKTYNISEISYENRGEYKCKCSNEVGHQESLGVTLAVVDEQSGVQSPVVIAVTIACVTGFVLVLIAVLLRRKKKICWSEEDTVQHDNVAAPSPGSDAPRSDSPSANQDEEVQYASIVHSKNTKSPIPRDAEQVVYASVQHRGEKAVTNHQEEDVQYASVHVSSSHRSDSVTAENPSVIYSSVK